MDRDEIQDMQAHASCSTDEGVPKASTSSKHTKDSLANIKLKTGQPAVFVIDGGGKGGKRRQQKYVVLWDQRQSYIGSILCCVAMMVLLVVAIIVIVVKTRQSDPDSVSVGGSFAREGSFQLTNYSSCRALVTSIQDSTRVDIEDTNQGPRNSRWTRESTTEDSTNTLIEGGKLSFQYDLVARVIVKSDGDLEQATSATDAESTYVYTAYNSELVVLSPSLAVKNSSVVVARVDITELFDLREQQLLLDSVDSRLPPLTTICGNATFKAQHVVVAAKESKLLVFGSALWCVGGPSPLVEASVTAPERRYWSSVLRPFLATAAVTFDISTPELPMAEAMSVYEGTFVSAHAVPGFVWLFTQQAPHDRYWPDDVEDEGPESTEKPLEDTDIMPIYTSRKRVNGTQLPLNWKSVQQCTSVEYLDSGLQAQYRPKLLTAAPLPLSGGADVTPGIVQNQDQHRLFVVAWDDQVNGIVTASYSSTAQGPTNVPGAEPIAPPDAYVFLAESYYAPSELSVASDTPTPSSASATEQAGGTNFTTVIMSLKIRQDEISADVSTSRQSGELLFQGAMHYDEGLDVLAVLSTSNLLSTDGVDRQTGTGQESSTFVLYDPISLKMRQQATRLNQGYQPSSVHYGALDDETLSRNAYVSLDFRTGLTGASQIQVLTYNVAESQPAAAPLGETPNATDAEFGGIVPSALLFASERVRLMKSFKYEQLGEFLLVAGQDELSTSPTYKHLQFSLYQAPAVQDPTQASRQSEPNLVSKTDSWSTEAFLDERAAVFHPYMATDDTNALTGPLAFALPVHLDPPCSDQDFQGVLLWKIEEAPDGLQVTPIGAIPTSDRCATASCAGSPVISDFKRVTFVDRANGDPMVMASSYCGLATFQLPAGASSTTALNTSSLQFESLAVNMTLVDAQYNALFPVDS